MTKIDPFQRFIDAQSPVYEEVLTELSAGQKTGHWMWFIFPQYVALGSSDRAKRYDPSGVEQAREFLPCPVCYLRALRPLSQSLLSFWSFFIAASRTP